ncbi:MAG: inorganic pyrophosphatase [Candidatus Kapabacteria bacterium]|nr:inorganic pyrophosphatase [Candidatus Kapabacteria bacterium]
MDNIKDFWQLASLRFKSHPWHGINIGPEAPEIVTAFIEVLPSDTLKYEVDKDTGYLKLDRPQKFSSITPAPYGFVPQTYCGKLIAQLCNERNNRTDILGDGDPLDICVLTERNIVHSNLLVQCRPIGGFRMIDGDEADDKIIAVLKQDEVYADWKDLNDVPKSLITRLKHYFLTYKDMPGQITQKCIITHTYGQAEACEVINRSRQDYINKFGKLENRLTVAALDAITKGQELSNKRKKKP